MADDADANHDDGAGSLARNRSRRSHTSRNNRDSALEKYKAARGGQLANKFEVEEVRNVYDVVDEKVYSKHVQDRQKDDWIVDDGTGEYYEDGREIFDDDLIDDDDTETGRSRKKGKSNKEKEIERQEKNQYKAGFQDLRNMFSSMPLKRKSAAPDGASSSKVSEDDLLGSLLKELHEVKKPKSTSNGISAIGLTNDLHDPSKTPTVSGAGTKFARKEGIEIKKSKFTSLGAGQVKPVAPSLPIKKKPKLEPAREPEEDFHMHDDRDTGFAAMDEGDDFRGFSPEPVEINAATKPKNGCVDGEIVNKLDDGIKTKSKADLNNHHSPLPSASTSAEVSHKEKKPKLPKYDFEETAGDIIGMDEDIDDAMSALMMDHNDSSDKKLNFFLLDIHEEPRNPGCLYLFGKVQESIGNYASCCVVVKNLMRCVYLLPKENDSPQDESNCDAILEEFDDVISPKFHISSFKARPVQKKYCFDVPNVPKASAYLEVRYAGSQQALPPDLKGESFTKVFGTSITLMETFLLEMKLKGPSWLQISNPSEVENSQHQSWSKFEFASDVRAIKLYPDGANMPVPPVVLVSLNVLSVNNASTKKDDIVFVGVAVNRKFHLQSAPATNSKYHESYCLINKPAGEVWPLDVDKVTNKRVTKFESERALLGCFLAKLQQIDADVILGHDINFELLLMHLLEYKLPHWSRIGRLKRSTNNTVKGKTIDFRAALAGRLLCDIKISAMELIRARSYDLPSLATQILGKKEDEVGSFTGPEMRQLFDSSQGLRCFTNWGMNHCVLNMQLVNELQVLPLALQITTIAGNTLSRTLLGGRSERNEFLLLHAFYEKGYIVPDKREKLPWKKGSNVKKEQETEADTEEGEGMKTGDDDKKGASYIGGLVLAPKKGFYDNYVVLMDFNSLYPSIIQEYNICFTTRLNLESAETDENRGILPAEIRRLVESRKQVKNLMKGANVSPDLMRQYDIRQKALKLTANSMYGCLGFRNSRFFAKELAALITGKGREILLKTKEAVEKMGFEVIYGDTDSIMINSNTQDIQKVYQIGNKIKAEINKMYKLLELEIDGVFRFLLLLKKKKYAALIYNAKPNGESETVLELKGLDMVRRDWAPVAGNTARLVLNEIMSEQPLDDKIFKIVKILNEVSVKLREGNIALKELLITKQLTKNPSEYKSAQGLHHVQVALKMNQKGNLAKKFRNGDTVSYLFCTDGSPHHLSELSQSASDSSSKSEENSPPLKPDPGYYLAQQIHPVVSRICDPIPGLDPARIAEALGMDASSYKRRRYYEENEEDKSLGEETEAEKYRYCEKFSFQCSNMDCSAAIVFEDFFKDSTPDASSNFLKCPTCKESQPTCYISNKLVLFIRKFVTKYYKNVYICEDPSCDNTERALPFKLYRGYPLCACGRGYMFKEYNDAELYKQLCYLQYTFDLEKQRENASEIKKAEISVIMTVKEYKETMDMLKTDITKLLLQSGYSEIKLSTLFQDLYPQRSKRQPKKSVKIEAPVTAKDEAPE